MQDLTSWGMLMTEEVSYASEWYFSNARSPNLIEEG